MFFDLPKRGGQFKNMFKDVQMNGLLKRYIVEIDKGFSAL